ncbi:hypothetical protein PG995_013877 [Apiospora arundinis]
MASLKNLRRLSGFFLHCDKKRRDMGKDIVLRQFRGDANSFRLLPVFAISRPSSTANVARELFKPARR